MASIFIALGGTGYKVVSRLQEGYKRYYSYINQNDENDYLYIDTDELSIKNVEGRGIAKAINLGTFRPSKIIQGPHNSQNKQDIENWLDLTNFPIPAQTLKSGAKGMRQLSRMAFYYNREPLETINQLLGRYMHNAQQAIDQNINMLNETSIYVVTGSAGGTGSGIFLDVIYSLWRYWIDNGGHGNLTITPIILMPNVFLGVSDPEVREQYEKNGYAFIQELNALIKYGHTNANDRFYNYVPKVYNTPTGHPWVPISNAIVIDNKNKNFTFEQNALYEVIAELLLTYTIGKQSGGVKTIKKDDGSQEVMTIEQLLNEALVNQQTNPNLEYINFFATFGLLVLKSANEYFDQFFQSQFRIDLMNSVIGCKLDNRSYKETEEYDALIKIIYDPYQKFINENLSIGNVEITNKTISRFKTETKDKLIKILENLDFAKNTFVKKGNIDKEEDILYDFLSKIQSKLIEVSNEIKEGIYSFHINSLRTGSKLSLLQQIAIELDAELYNRYHEDINTKYDNILINWLEIVKLKANLFILDKVSGCRSGMEKSGFLDNLSHHLLDLRSNFVKIKDIEEKRLSKLITDLNIIHKNGVIRIAPEIGNIIQQTNNVFEFRNDGTFFRWYEEMDINFNECQINVFSNLYNSNEKGLIITERFKKENYNNLLKSVVDIEIKRIKGGNQAYIAIMNKSLRDVLHDEECNNLVDHILDFNYPFIELLHEHTIDRKAYAGHFNGDIQFMRDLGHDENNFNDVPIDSPFFKDKIIKIVFANGIHLDNYFKFPDMRSTYTKKFVDLRKKGLKAISPFLHKEFEGENYSGDVFNSLMSLERNEVLQGFNTLRDDIRQELIKFGLLYLYYYTRVGIESKIFADNFNEQIIDFNETENKICLRGVKIHRLKNTMQVDTSITQEFQLKESLNIQGTKNFIKKAVTYVLNSRESELDKKIEATECLFKAFDFFNADLIGDTVEVFYDDTDETLTSSILIYFETILS